MKYQADDEGLNSVVNNSEKNTNISTLLVSVSRKLENSKELTTTASLKSPNSSPMFTSNSVSRKTSKSSKLPSLKLSKAAKPKRLSKIKVSTKNNADTNLIIAALNNIEQKLVSQNADQQTHLKSRLDKLEEGHSQLMMRLSKLENGQKESKTSQEDMEHLINTKLPITNFQTETYSNFTNLTKNIDKIKEDIKDALKMEIGNEVKGLKQAIKKDLETSNDQAVVKVNKILVDIKEDVHNKLKNLPDMLKVNDKQNNSGRVNHDSSKQTPPSMSNKFNENDKDNIKNVLYVADSIGQNIDFQFIGKKIDSFRSEVAYSATYDIKAKYPTSNFTDVVKNSLNKEPADALIIQGGSVDITNLDTQTDPFGRLELMKQTIRTSSQNIFKIAENALTEYPQLQKVIIMERIERFDLENSDPFRIKSQLSKLGNQEYQSLLNESKFKDKIIVQKNDLNFPGSTREKRFGSPQNIKFDGIHTTTSQGKSDLTQNLLNTLSQASILKYKYEYLPNNSIYQNPHTKGGWNLVGNKNQSQTRKTFHERFTYQHNSGNKQRDQWPTPNEMANKIFVNGPQSQKHPTDSRGFSLTGNRFDPLIEMSWAEQTEAEFGEGENHQTSENR